MESLVQAVFENSEKMPSKTAIVFDKTEVTYKEFSEKINLFANSLKEKKIKKGSRIIIESSDLISFFSAFLGCQLAGCIAVPIEKGISVYKLHDVINAIKPALVFIKNGENYKDYFKPAVCKKIAFPNSQAESVIVSTTGTTGNPALVCHTNKSLLAAIQNLSEGTSVTENTVLLTNMPFHLVSGYRRVFAALYLGGTAVVTNRSITMQTLGEFAEKYYVNHLSLVSTDLALLLNEASLNRSQHLYSVKRVESATSILTFDVVATFHNLFPDVTLYNVYGTTESGCLLINNTCENLADSCIGRPTRNADVFVVDENGERITTAGKYGYVAVRGDMNMKGYYKKKAQTDMVMHGDTIILNDIVYQDKQGLFYFVSRVGDVINVKGQKIIPSEIERVAMRFSGVKDCACVAKDDETSGQVPVLYVVCEDSNFDFDKLKEHLKENLESYRVPRSVIPIDKIPHTSAGKVMRKHLSMLAD